MFRQLTPNDRLLKRLSDSYCESMPLIAQSLSKTSAILDQLEAQTKVHARGILSLFERCDELERRLDTLCNQKNAQDATAAQSVAMPPHCE